MSSEVDEGINSALGMISIVPPLIATGLVIKTLDILSDVGQNRVRQEPQRRQVKITKQKPAKSKTPSIFNADFWGF